MSDELPEYIEDWRGQKIYPGDCIIYSTCAASSSYMKEALVIGFAYSKSGHKRLKMKVQVLRTTGWSGNKISYLEVRQNATYTKMTQTFANWEVL